jgi:hypothetical protein
VCGGRYGRLDKTTSLGPADLGIAEPLSSGFRLGMADGDGA